MADYQTAEHVKEEVVDCGFVEDQVEIKEEVSDCGSVEVDQVKTEVKDSDFVEMDSHGVHQLCTACLCATRTTHTLDDVTLRQYYMNILTETQLEADEPVLQSPRLCWECVAHLKRSVRFREQVQDSYRLLQPMLLMNDNEDVDEFLQTSVRRPGRLRTCFAYSIDISAEDDDTPVKTADEDANAAASNYLEFHIEAYPSTVCGTVATPIIDGDTTMKPYNDTNIVACVSGDINKEFEESDAHTSKPVNNCHNNESISNKINNLIQRNTCSGLKPFKCEVCHTSFAYVGNLTTHRRIHTGEKPFKCEVCYKLFAADCNLIMHRKTHTDEKLFKCKVCCRAFAHQRHLNLHRRVHITHETHETSFECELCYRSFTQRSMLNQHRRTHTMQTTRAGAPCPPPRTYSRRPAPPPRPADTLI